MTCSFHAKYTRGITDVFEDKAHKRICTFVCSCKAKRDVYKRQIIGCMNETGTRQRADNISGLLGEKEMASYLYSQPKEKLSEMCIRDSKDTSRARYQWHMEWYEWACKLQRTTAGSVSYTHQMCIRDSIYGKDGLSTTPIQNIEQGEIDQQNRCV